MASRFVMANMAAALAQCIFGVGQVVGKLGMSANMSPLMFYLVRVGLSGIIFLAFAAMSNASLCVRRSDIPGFLMAGASMWVGQFFFIVGLKLSSPVTAAVWQPTQPIFTLIFATAMGMEKLSIQKCFGILLAFAGCTVITTLTMTDADETRSTSWVGHPLFLLNCCGTPLQLLAMKPLLKRYATPLVTGYAFMVSAALFLASTWAFSRHQQLLDFVCPPDTQPCGDGWQFPREAVWALGYYTIFGSLVSYSLNAWSSKFIDGSLTSCYTGAQPIAAALASLTVIHATDPPHHGLEPPQRAHVIGTASILAGLWLVVRSSRDATASKGGDGTDTRKKIT